MNKMTMRLLGAALLLAAAGLSPAFAQEKSRDEKKLDAAAASLDKEAGAPDGQKTVVNKIMETYKVDEARVQALRDQKLGYGEVSIALGLAQGLPGGINDENVAKVMALRQGPPVMGWGKLAKELGLKLGPVVSKVNKAAESARGKGKPSGAGKPAGAEGRDKAERPERGERPQRPERPGKGGGRN